MNEKKCVCCFILLLKYIRVIYTCNTSFKSLSLSKEFKLIIIIKSDQHHKRFCSKNMIEISFNETHCCFDNEVLSSFFEIYHINYIQSILDL